MTILIEVVYALAQAQTIVELHLPEGATVADALAAPRVQEMLSGHPFAGSRIGVWGAAVTLDTPLRDRDRLEIYRDLLADPKQARRRRAAEQRGRGTGR